MNLPEPLTLLLSLALGIALAASSGFRVFLPLLVASIGMKLGWIPSGKGFEWMSSTPALLCFLVATLTEIIGYLVPFVDHGLDVLAAPLSVGVGALLATSVMGDHVDPMIKYTLPILLGGGAAGVVQAGTSLLRIGSTKLTGGIGNPLFSKVETLAALVGSLISIWIPLIACGIFLLVIFFCVRAIMGWRKRKKIAVS